MKRSFDLIIAICILLMIQILSVQSEALDPDDPEKMIDGFAYSVNDESVTILYYTGSGPIVHIPEMIDGLPVTVIGEGAFFESEGIWTVVVPDTVVMIEDHAFCGCTLREILLPAGLQAIGEGAFARSKLTSIYIPASVNHMGNTVFYYCYDLRSVYIDASITSIPFGTFMVCDNLHDVHLSDTIERIEEVAFYGTISLEEINIPKSLKYVDHLAGFEADDIILKFMDYTVADEDDSEEYDEAFR